MITICIGHPAERFSGNAKIGGYQCLRYPLEQLRIQREKLPIAGLCIAVQ